MTIQISTRIEGGNTHDDYDTGRVTEIEGDEVTVAWDSGVSSTQHADVLRPEGTLVLYVSDEDIARLRTEAGAAGDEDQVALCDFALEGDDDARAECIEVIVSARREAAVA